MKVRKFLVFIAFLFFFLTPKIVFAQVSCCSQNGGQYACDYSTNKLYCKDGSVSKECICKLATPTPSPSPIPSPVPTLPSCVPYSVYDTTSKACRCNSGYIVKENVCVSYAQYCWSSFGGNSVYDSEKNTCTCVSGYGWSSDGKSCISFDQLCQNIVGDKSYFNKENNTCSCYQGNSIQENRCQPIPPSALNPQIVQVKITQIPTPTTKIAQSKEAVSLTPAKVRNEKKASTLVVKNAEENNFVAIQKPQKSVIKVIIYALRRFLSRIF